MGEREETQRRQKSNLDECGEMEDNAPIEQSGNTQLSRDMV